MEGHHFKYFDKKPINPDVTQTKDSKSITVWAAMNYDELLGPYFLTAIEDVDSYQLILSEFVRDLRKLTPSHERPIFMHDNLQVHRLPTIRAYLEKEFPHRWIGHGSNYSPWPHHSADLNPMNFFLWGFIKGEIYKKPIELDDVVELEHRIMNAFKRVTPTMLAEAIGAYKSKLEHVVKSDGALVDACVSHVPTKFPSDRHFGPMKEGIARLCDKDDGE